MNPVSAVRSYIDKLFDNVQGMTYLLLDRETVTLSILCCIAPCFKHVTLNI